jgi:hypothetical protein
MEGEIVTEERKPLEPLKTSNNIKKSKKRRSAQINIQKISENNIYEEVEEKLKILSKLKYKSDNLQELIQSGSSILLFFISDLKSEIQHQILEDFKFYFRKIRVLNCFPILITSRDEKEFEAFFEKTVTFHIIFDKEEEILKNFGLNIFIPSNDICILIQNNKILNHLISESNKKRINFIRFVLKTSTTLVDIDSFYSSNSMWSQKRRSKAIVTEKIYDEDNPDSFLPAYLVLSPTNFEEEEEIVKQKIVKKKQGVLNRMMKSRGSLIDDEVIVNIQKKSHFSDTFIEKNQKNLSPVFNTDSPLEIEIDSPSSHLRHFASPFANAFDDYDSLIQLIKKNDNITEKLGDFSYDEMFENLNYFEEFKKFLKKEFSFENALFFEDSLKFEKEKIDMKSLYDEIILKYFNFDSEFEINVSNKIKLEISSRAVSENYPSDLFSDIRKELKYGIMFDSYTRFVRTKEFAQMVKK